jgi:hypothetical protein
MDTECKTKDTKTKGYKKFLHADKCGMWLQVLEDVLAIDMDEWDDIVKSKQKDNKQKDVIILLGRFGFKTMSTDERDGLVKQLILGSDAKNVPGSDLLSFMAVPKKFSTLMEHEWYHDVFLDDAFKAYLYDATIVSNDENIGNFKDLRFQLYTQIHAVITALPEIFDMDDLVKIVLESEEKIEPLTKLKHLIGNVGLQTHKINRTGTGKERKINYSIGPKSIVVKYNRFIKITGVYKEQLSRMKAREEVLPKTPEKNELKRKFDQREEEQKIAKRGKCSTDAFRGNYIFI